MSAPPVPEGDELQYFKAQNTQLWKVITKQKSVIHKLQKETTRLLAERDELIQKLEARGSQHKQEEPPRPLVQSPEPLPVTISASPTPSGHQGEPSAAVPNESPVPPPRSPYRQNSAKDMPTKDVPRNEPPIPKPIVAPITSDVRVEERKPAPEPIILPNSPPSPVPDVLSPRKAIIDKDAQLFAEFNASLMKRERQKPNTALVNATFPRDYQKEAEQLRYEALKKTGTPTEEESEQSSTTTATSMNGHSLTQSPTPQPSSFETSVNSYSPPESSSNSKQPEPSSFDPSGMSNETLASLSIKVVASKIKANEKDKEVLCFIISVGRMLKPPSTDSDCSDLQFEELWRVEKLYSDFINLDARMRAGVVNEKQRPTVKFPEKSLFNTLSPTKVDQRKIALERYLQQLILNPLEHISVICEFLSTDVVQHVASDSLGYKEGYLTKRGKNFGGWKRRYFVIQNHRLFYYDNKNGTQLGVIHLKHAKIGRQAPQTASDAKDSKMFRHAFLVLEHKKSGSSVLARHILCAESDFERDEWIDALIYHVNAPDEEPSPEPNTPTTPQSKDNNTVLGKFKKLRKPDKRHKSTYDFNNDSVPVSRKTFEISGTEDTRFSDSTFAIKQQRSNSDPAITPIIRPSPRERTPLRPSKSRLNSNDDVVSNDSGFDTNDTLANDSSAARNSVISLKDGQGDSEHQIWSPDENTSSPIQTEKEMLSPPTTSTSSSRQSRAARRLTGKLTGWGKKAVHTPDDTEGSEPSLPTPEDFKEPVYRLQFAIPLQVAIDVTRSTIPIELPAVVYRCIEYLDAKNAVMEEGIYRQSGSTAVVNELREKFDKEGDYNILESGVYYDVHAVAGLLKMWLRELPTEVLTVELHDDFLGVIGKSYYLMDPAERLSELGRLISLLPVAHYTLLRALSAHILQVVQNASVNKMSILNIGIVFALTLGIPGSILNMLLTEFDYVFWTSDEIARQDGDGQQPGQEYSGHDHSREVRDLEESDVDDEQEEDMPEKEPERPKQEKVMFGKNMLTVIQGDGYRNNRNSMIFSSGAPNAIKHIEKHLETTQPMLLSDEDDEDDSNSVYSNDSAP
ncbi:hypothetical protein INT44_004781 [Umbelopsis vinacea]|uniref:RhoGAP-domain-containing protein n=1 Tax=Umbelopsis vinacea TaxID=44442 RepID=A0A8H7Q990_9FUNG|nr:hypothetical protein INT44_004781 [Umbelopsis vinacea]